MALNETNAKSRNNWRSPSFDITEDKDSFFVYLDMPGVNQDRLEVEYHNRELTVTGNVDNARFENFRLGWQEYAPYGFRRRFTIPDHINPDGIMANIRNGVVKLTLPKSEAIKPRRIEINAQ